MNNAEKNSDLLRRGTVNIYAEHEFEKSIKEGNCLKINVII